jgi:tetratricopeptide (TPR) repeat protein
MKTGRSNEAIIHYQKALQTNPNYADAHNNLGNAFLQTGQVDEAIAHYQRALEINPNKINTLQNLASTFEQKGQLPDAISFLQKALTLAKSAGDESMIKEITMNLDRLNQMIRSSPQGSR